MTIVALVDAYRGGELTRDELFAAMTKLLSGTPGLLRGARNALDFDSAVRSEFEAWLDGLRDRPQILLGGRYVAVASALISALAASDECPTLEPIEAAGAASRPKRPVLGSRAEVQFMEARRDA